MELARPLDPSPAEKPSALAGLRLQRKLTVEEAAKRAALWPDQVEWLEDGRLYRFPTSEAAVLALLRYATSLGIDHREARRLAGLPVEPPPPRRSGAGSQPGPPPPPRRDALTAIFVGFAGRVDAGEQGGRAASGSLEDQRRRPQRQRRHQLHAPGRDARRLVRLPHRARHEGEPLRLQADGHLLRARRRGARPPARVPARLRHDQPASRRPRRAPAGRDHGPAQPGLLSPAC